MKRRKLSGQKVAVGMFLDGTSLQVVSLAKVKNEIQLVDAQLITLTSQPEPAPAGEMVITEDMFGEGQDGNPIDLTDELNNSESEELDSSNDQNNSGNRNREENEILENELIKLSHKKYKIAMSVAEPEIYYATFSTDWGLKDDKLKLKIIENLVAEKPTALDLSPDDLRVIKMADGGILAVVRGADLYVLNILEKTRRHLRNKMPKISFIETAEVSLVNLVKANYDFKEDEHSVIIYVGQEFSRLIFMHGNDLANISQIIGEGIDSPDIASTIYSRLLLALDTLNLNNVNHIILTGEAEEGNVLRYLREKFSLDVNVEYLKFNHLAVNNIDSVLSRFGVAVGVAWHALADKQEKFCYVDLLPKEIREKQKIFKLGIVGWVLFLMLPLLAFYFTYMASKRQNELMNLQDELKFKKEELAALEIPKMKLDVLNKKIENNNKIFTVLD
ncbi:MAG: hypothetical protein ACE5GL_05415, partial [Calditrichia bacterium]